MVCLPKENVLPDDTNKTESTFIDSADTCNNPVEQKDSDDKYNVKYENFPPQDINSSYMAFSPYLKMEPSYNQFLYKTTKIQIDIIMVSLTLLSMFFHTVLLTKPTYPIFNEKKYVDNIRHYSENRFFLDADPPLFIILSSIVVKFLQLDIGQSAEVLLADKTISFHLRILPALFSVFITPLVYAIMENLNFSKLSSVLMSLCVICNSFIVTDARHVSPNSLFIFLALLSVLFTVKACNTIEKPFTQLWWVAHVGVGISLGFAISTLHIGFNTYLFVTLLILIRAWKRFGVVSICEIKLWGEFVAKFLLVVLLPLVIYLVFYCLLVVVCYKTGPSDSMVSSRFQSTLRENMVSYHNNSHQWVYDKSLISLKTEDPAACWLHSHPHFYPDIDPLDRQQVTCYDFEDENNWWTIESVTAWQEGGEPYFVRDKDTIRLKHAVTNGYLALNKDIPCQSNPAGSLVSVVNNTDHNNTEWTVDIIHGAGPHGLWAVGKTRVRLINTKTNDYLVTSGEQLPAWGFNQKDMAGSHLAAAEWTVTETRNEFSELIKSLTANRISLLGKVFEIHYNLFVSGKFEKLENRQYDSSPYTWLKPGLFIVYSYEKEELIVSQGNTCLEFSMLLSVMCYLITLWVIALRRCRGCFDVSEVSWSGLCRVLWFFILGFIVHYFPFFFLQRPLFVYQFQLSYIWLCMGCCAYIDIMVNMCGKYIKVMVVGIALWALCLFVAFVQNFPYCVATHVEKEDLVWVY